MSTENTTTIEQPAPAAVRSTDGLGVWSDPTVCDDEKHMAAALYLLHKAIALRDQPGNGWPTIHACLRDAAIHCEAARQRWTKEAVAEIDRVAKELFGEDAKTPNNALNNPHE